MELEKIQIKDLPQELMERMSQRIKWYSIGLVGVANREAGEKGNLIGSGTLIRIEKTFCILTAHHVVDSQRFRSSTEIGFLYLEYPHSHRVRRQYLQIKEIAKTEEPSRGPDLAIIIPPENDVRVIKAKKSFVTVSPKRLEELSNSLDSRTGRWVVCGFPDEYTEEVGAHRGFDNFTRFTGIGGYSGIEREWVDGEYDYVDVSVLYKDKSDLPKDFGGVSGGGLWKIPLLRNDEGEIIAQEPILAGVPFYQTAVENNKCFIRCHGPRSVYEMVYNAVKS